MICYKLQSCNPSSYPDINNLCWEERVLDSNKIVYINNNPLETYRLVLEGENVCICNSTLPPYVVVNGGVCSEAVERKCYIITNCNDIQDTLDVCLGGLPVIVGDSIEIAGSLICYFITSIQPDTGQNTEIVTRIIDNCGDCQTTIFYNILNCQTFQTTTAELIGGGVSGDVVKVLENGGCWQVQNPSPTKAVTYNVIEVYENADCTDCTETLATGFYNLESCTGAGIFAVELIGGTPSLGEVISVLENGDCWKVIEVVQSAGFVWSYEATLPTCGDCNTSITCKEDAERTLAYYNLVKLPTPTEPDKGFKECCYTNLVLGDLVDNNPYKNDFTGFYFKGQTLGDECDFILHQIGTGATFALNSSLYGIFKEFGDIVEQPNLKTFIVEWRKVLDVLGSGLYRVEKSMIIGGLAFSQMSNTFTLEPFNNTLADKTIRIDSKLDGELVHLDTNFKGSGFETSIRLKGFFGRRNPTYTQDNIVKRDYSIVQISMSQDNEHELQTNLIPECITGEVYDFILFGDELRISDYNLINHSYKYILYEVELSSNKGAKYYTTNRDSKINLIFKDRIKNKRKINC